MATANAAEVLTNPASWLQGADSELLVNDRVWTIERPFAQKFTIPVTSVNNTNNITRLAKMPAGAYIWQWVSTPTDMDTGTAALVYDIVATDDSDVVKLTLVSGSTKAQAASGTDQIAASAMGCYVGNYWLSFKVTTPANVAAAGTLKCAWKITIGVINRSARKAFLGDAFA